MRVLTHLVVAVYVLVRAAPVVDAAALPLLAGVVVLGVELRAGQPLAAAEVAPVRVGARVLAGAVTVVQQALVLVRAERTLGGRGREGF